MAKLSFTDRRMTVCPDILGNRGADDPFFIRVKRISDGELAAFRDAADALRRRLVEGVPASEIAELFGGLIDGPHGTVTVDDVAVDGMTVIYELAAREFPFVGCIFDGLAGAITVANELSGEAEKNFERRRGGAGTTATAAPSPPSDASVAESSSSEDATS